MGEGAVRSDHRRLYEQVQAAVLVRLMNGAYAAGEKLPPEDRLAASLGVSRTTVRTALANLEALGHIHRVQGAGTFVAQRPPAVEVQLDALESFHPRLAARLGIASTIRDLEIGPAVADDEMAAAMDLPAGADVVCVSRTVEFDGIPVASLSDYVPVAVAGLADLRAGFCDSVLDYFDGRPGRPLIEWCDSHLSAAPAGPPIASLLRVAEGQTLLLLDELFYNSDGMLISRSLNYIIPEYFRFHIWRRVPRQP